MELMDIQERLTAIFRQVFQDSTLQVSKELTADDVPGWDSLSNMDLIFTIEKAFSIHLTTREVRKMRNVGDLMDLIEKKISEAAQG